MQTGLMKGHTRFMGFSVKFQKINFKLICWHHHSTNQNLIMSHLSFLFEKKSMVVSIAFAYQHCSVGLSRKLEISFHCHQHIQILGLIIPICPRYEVREYSRDLNDIICLSPLTRGHKTPTRCRRNVGI